MFCKIRKLASKIGSRQEKVLKEFDILCEKKIRPSFVSNFVYKKDQDHGIAVHTDIYYVFGTVICVINETPEEKLQCQDPFSNGTIGDLIVLDPIMKHWVEAGKRHKDRKSLVSNF